MVTMERTTVSSAAQIETNEIQSVDKGVKTISIDTTGDALEFTETIAANYPVGQLTNNDNSKQTNPV